MAVEPVHDWACKRCGRRKGAVNKWWLVKIEGAVWTFRDFKEHALPEFDYALCSSSCLMNDAQEHADKLINSVDATNG
jgi:hypothetical protein